MAVKTRKISGKAEDIIFDTVNYIVLTIVIIVTLYPFLNVLAVSFNDAIDSVRGGIYLFPRKFTTFNYKSILTDPQIYNATVISALRAIIGSALNVLCSIVVAYAISRKDFVLRGIISRIFIYSMYFSSGLIPYYLLIKNLHLMNNFLVYILPSIVSAWNIMVVRSYIDGLPVSLIESAKLDGASELRIIFSIIFPLSVPVLATITLFVAVGQWNSWFDTMLFCSTNPHLSTLQYELQKVLQSTQQFSMQASFDQAVGNKSSAVTPESIRAAMTIVAITPILFVYPFLQKYFVKGLTIGGVKG
ncbi:carbohydrate ABC transporter permease [Caldanaerobius polysaccharolyticus]|uniref:carbohydrate ABC transporter permease n=1 Tax=Caldanaerobius polysaccharolyticus TaxID=44256 RepID=UPI00068D0966|nr:carbohydrate ABC transporter permease [Caldanaerobius polysaccharolyticus]